MTRAPAMAYEAFVDELEAFANALPAQVERSFRRDQREFELAVKAPTPAHRDLSMMGDSSGVEFTVGDIWTEPVKATPELFVDLLAACDALKAGGVRECRDRRTGVLYHVYRLRTRGLKRFVVEGQYSFWHSSIWRWLGLKIRSVSIHRLPPLDSAEVL
jgi:hypothetical protein